MKTFKNRLLPAFFSIISILGIFNSCTEESVLKSLPYLFRPINLAASINSTVVTLTWAKVDSATNYTVQISTDSVNYSNPVVDLTTTSTSLVKELAGNTQFFARIRANAADPLKNSKFNTTLKFKTPKENIFGGFGTKNNTGNTYSAYMSAANTLDIRWRPGANVTHLILTSGATRDSVIISPTEATAGKKVVASRANANWNVSIYNGKILRGTTFGLVEGDIIVDAAGDISTALNNASAGQVILLTGGNNYTIGNTEYKFAKNVKIRSTSPVNRANISMTALSGTPPTTSSNMMSVVASAALDSLVFENIDFTGYCDNSVASTKIGYLFSNKVACTVGKVLFTNCNLHNFGNTTFRLSGGVNQRFTNVIFNGSIVSEIGFTSTYAIVNSNSADFVDNVILTNSTFYNIKGSIVLRTGAYTMNSIIITNCNFNQIMMDPSSARYLIDANTTTITAGTTIKNSIFGMSGAALGANGYRGVAAPVFTGCYITSDYVDDAVPLVTSTSIRGKAGVSQYSGASTSLWNNPVNGDFSLKDTNFVGKGIAGDLRW